MTRRPLAALLALALCVQPAAAAVPQLSVRAASPAPLPLLPAALATPFAVAAPTPSLGALIPAPVAGSNPAPVAFSQLSGFSHRAEPISELRLRFDGSLPGPAGRPDPIVAPGKDEKKPGALRRLNRASGASSRAGRWFERSLLIGTVVGAAAPVLASAEPVHALPVNLGVAAAAALALLLAATGYRMLRYLVRGPAAARPPSRRATVALALALGLSLGAAVGVAPTVLQSHVAELAASTLAGEQELRRIPGAAFRDELLAALSANPEGRRILDELRDRTGTIRLPAFLVGQKEMTAAWHHSLFNAVVVDIDEIVQRGWTVEQFLSDPAVQRTFVSDFQDSMAHELTHAAQARRALKERGHFGENSEREREAYLREHLYVHELLKQDPGAARIGGYEEAVDDLDGYLARVLGHPLYANKARSEIPSVRAFLSELRGGWTAHRLEAYELLARRYEAQKLSALAAQARAKAEALRKS